MFFDYQARKQVAKHIELEGYAERFNDTDLIARGNVTIAQYVESIRVPSIIEKWYLKKSIALATAQQPQWISHIPWRILFFGQGERGLPHTHGPFIMLPTSYNRNVSPSLLVHEKVHIYQRYHPIESVLKHAQQYPISGFEYPALGQRANPDTSRILFGDIRPTYYQNATNLTDIKDARDHPFELEAYKY